MSACTSDKEYLQNTKLTTKCDFDYVRLSAKNRGGAKIKIERKEQFTEVRKMAGRAALFLPLLLAAPAMAAQCVQPGACMDFGINRAGPAVVVDTWEDCQVGSSR